MQSTDLTRQQEILLKACLAPDSDFPRLLTEWEEAVELDDIDYGSLRLVPYLYRKLERNRLTARDHGRLRGIYARFWALHHTRATPALDAVASLPMTYLVLKGTALQTMVYGNDPATRPSDDVDVLVHPSHREAALRYLLRNGFQEQFERPLEMWLKLRKCVGLTRNGVDLDLQWNIFYWSKDDKLTDRMFERAVEIDYRGRPLLALSPTDALLHAVTHGYGINEVPPIRWVLDAALLIRSGEVDWNLFVAESKASGWARSVATQLEILVEVFQVQIPGVILNQLRRSGGRVDFAIQRVYLRSPSVWARRLARVFGWDKRVLASNLGQKASHFDVIRLMWKEYRWLKKHDLLAR